MKSIYLFMAVILLSVLMASCEKDEVSKVDLLTTGKWKMSALTVEPAIDWFGTRVTNVYAQLPSCIQDDLTIFKIDGTVLYDEGPTKCESHDPQTTTAKWVFNPLETILSIADDGETQSWDLKTLDKNLFSVRYSVTEDFTTYTFDLNFIKI